MFPQVVTPEIRYIYLWIMYALFEETEMGDIERTREVWKACLEILPHKKEKIMKINQK